MTKQAETIEAQPRTRAEIEKELAALEAEKQALRAAEGLAAAQADAKIRAEEAELVRIVELANVMSWAAGPWKLIHELAGKHAEDPRFILGLTCYLAARPANANENTLRDNLRAFVEGWELGIDPGNVSLVEVPGFRELQAKHVEREEAARARVKQHYAPVRP